MLSTTVMAGLGFLFWIICSHLYPASEIGIITSLVAASGLATTFSALGFNNALIRFLPSAKHKNRFISTAFMLTTIASFFSGAIFFFLLRNIVVTHSAAPNLILVGMFFMIYVALLTTNSVLDSVFISNRSAKFIFFKNCILSLVKVGLPFVLVSFGYVGILAAIVFATFTAIIYGFIILFRSFQFQLSFDIDNEALEDTRRFTTGNYIGSIFSTMPATIVPLIVVSSLGTERAAFFYMPMMIIGFLNVIPIATAQSLFAEVSNDEDNVQQYLRHSLRNLFSLMVPASLVIIAGAGLILTLFGPAYAHEGTTTLRILAVGSLVGALNFFGDTMLNIKKLSKLYIFMNAFNAIIIILVTYLLSPRGLEWVAFAWLIGQLVTLMVYLLLNWRLLRTTLSANPSIT